MVVPREVYAIQHIATGRIYVGSSANLEQRLRDHMNALKSGKHPNKMMQEDYDNYGGDYEFFVLEKITEFVDRSKEYDWMEKLNTGNPEVGYNSRDPYFTRQPQWIPEITPGVPTPNESDEIIHGRRGRNVSECI